MRRELLLDLPAFSAIYHIHPWQIAKLTYRELAVYLSQVEKFYNPPR